MSGQEEVDWSAMPDMCRFYEAVPCVTARTVFVYEDGRAAVAARLPCAELMAYATKTQGVWTAVEAFNVLQCLVTQTKLAETSFPAFVAANSASERLLAPWTTELTRQCVETGQTLETALVVHPVVRACIGQAFFFSQPISDELLFKTVLSLKLCDELPASFAWLLSHQNLPKFHQVSTTLDLLFQHCDQLPNSIVFVFKHPASISVSTCVAQRIRTLIAPNAPLTTPLDGTPFTLSAAAFADTPPSPNALKVEFAIRAALVRIREREAQLLARLQVAALRRKALNVAKLFSAFLAQSLPENFPPVLVQAAHNDQRAASLLAGSADRSSSGSGSASAADGLQQRLREMEARHSALCSVLDECVLAAKQNEFAAIVEKLQATLLKANGRAGSAGSVFVATQTRNRMLQLLLPNEVTALETVAQQLAEDADALQLAKQLEILPELCLLNVARLTQLGSELGGVVQQLQLQLGPKAELTAELTAELKAEVQVREVSRSRLVTKRLAGVSAAAPSGVTTRTSSRQCTPGTRPAQLQTLEHKQIPATQQQQQQQQQQRQQQQQKRKPQATTKAPVRAAVAVPAVAAAGSTKSRGLLREAVRVVPMKF